MKSIGVDGASGGYVPSWVEEKVVSNSSKSIIKKSPRNKEVKLTTPRVSFLATDEGHMLLKAPSTLQVMVNSPRRRSICSDKCIEKVHLYSDNFKEQVLSHKYLPSNYSEDFQITLGYFRCKETVSGRRFSAPDLFDSFK